MTRWWRRDESKKSEADLDESPSAALPTDKRTIRCCKSSPAVLPSRRIDRKAISSKLHLHAEPEMTKFVTSFAEEVSSEVSPRSSGTNDTTDASDTIVGCRRQCWVKSTARHPDTQLWCLKHTSASFERLFRLRQSSPSGSRHRQWSSEPTCCCYGCLCCKRFSMASSVAFDDLCTRCRYKTHQLRRLSLYWCPLLNAAASSLRLDPHPVLGRERRWWFSSLRFSEASHAAEPADCSCWQIYRPKRVEFGRQLMLKFSVVSPLTGFTSFPEKSSFREQNHPLAFPWNVRFLDVRTKLHKSLLAMTRTLQQERARESVDNLFMRHLHYSQNQWRNLCESR